MIVMKLSLRIMGLRKPIYWTTSIEDRTLYHSHVMQGKVVNKRSIVGYWNIDLSLEGWSIVSPKNKQNNI